MTTIPFKPNRFRSTAAYYTRYRVPYPAELIAAVADRAGLKPGDRVLDLGCGPAQLAIAFARLGMNVMAMDPEPEMLAAAADDIADAGVAVELRQGSSYDLGQDLGRFRLVTMGRSFHWMDRPATLMALDGLIEPGGAVALFGDRRINSSEDWQGIVNRTQEQYSPEGSDARRARRSPDWLHHESVLLDSAFSELWTLGRPFAQQLTLDDILGRVYSMSVTSPETLGEGRETFETALRAELAVANPSGQFTEVVSAEAILASRPA